MAPIARAAILAMALAALLTTGYGLESARAATINVACSTADLTAAINTANNETTNPGLDTLELTAGCNYAYTTAAGGGTALPPINSAITINGHGAAIRRDPAAAARFRIIAVVGPAVLTINETTISGGRATNGASAGQVGEVAGGIRLTSGNLTIVDSTITDNQAGNGNSNGLTGGNGGAGGAGGGIYAAGGSLTIVDSTISGNSAGNGGTGRSGVPPVVALSKWYISAAGS